MIIDNEIIGVLGLCFIAFLITFIWFIKFIAYLIIDEDKMKAIDNTSVGKRIKFPTSINVFCKIDEEKEKDIE